MPTNEQKLLLELLAGEISGETRLDKTGLLQSVETAVEMNKNGDYGIPVPYYTEENVSTKVVKIIQSYTGVVNKIVWRKF